MRMGAGKHPVPMPLPVLMLRPLRALSASKQPKRHVSSRNMRNICVPVSAVAGEAVTDRVLVVGSTGRVGGLVVRELSAAGRRTVPIRCGQ